MYDIEISQSRFPGKALDPTLRGLFPKYHEWTEIHVPKWYARWDEVVYATARRNEIVLLGESDIVVHIIGEGRNGHSDDYQNYLKSRGTDYLFCFGEKAASPSVSRMNRPACCCSSM